MRLDADATNAPVPAGATQGATTNNGNTNVPSILLTPVSVTTSNIQSTFVADGFWTVAQIRTPDYAAACAQAGLH